MGNWLSVNETLVYVYHKVLHENCHVRFAMCNHGNFHVPVCFLLECYRLSLDYNTNNNKNLLWLWMAEDKFYLEVGRGRFFKYKIIHNILATNSILYKMNKVASPACPFCPSDCQIIHICLLAARKRLPFVPKYQSWYSTVCSANLLLSGPEVYYLELLVPVLNVWPSTPS